MKIITSVEVSGKVVQVEKLTEENYQAVVDGVVKHPNCTAEDVMRALSMYLQAFGKSKT